MFLGPKFCPPLLETVALRIYARYLKEYSIMNVCSSNKNCPSAACTLGVDVVCRDIDVCGTKSVSLNDIL
jgi:hypothetical protein